MKYLLLALALVSSPVGAVINLRVNLTEQQVYVYNDDVLVDSSPISSGKIGYETPIGTFNVSRKETYHWSRKYHAPMPYAQFFTGGIAFHAGHLPGYAASHGCIRLPSSFAKKLYNITKIGTTVIVEE